jgi:hypothetical protein
LIILGLNAHHADASACLLIDGKLVAAVEEERFTRIKHFSGFPIHAVDYCLQQAGLSLNDIDHLVIGRDPNAKFKEKMTFFVKAPSQLLKKYFYDRFINVKDVKVGSTDAIKFPYFWRFLSFFEDTPSIVRDLDSRFSDREVSYINSWLNNDKDYFIIRDHPWHSPVPAGLFGIKRKIQPFEDHMIEFVANNSLSWGADQDILHLYMEKINKESIFYCGFDDATNYIPRDDKNFFIGMQIDENNQPIIPSATVALEYLNSMNL